MCRQTGAFSANWAFELGKARVVWADLVQKRMHFHEEAVFPILIFIFSLSPSFHFHINVCARACRWLQSEGSPTYLPLNNSEL